MKRNYPDVAIPFSVSIGGSQTNSEMTSLEQLLECADQNLYRAKSAGRGRVVVS
ncbi:MAG: diguanylate cyclase (GGDEF)-like protein [Parasphingorhabdus sp.]|jgi:diguanylate cyclase (GGDEF)-like protein